MAVGVGDGIKLSHSDRWKSTERPETSFTNTLQVQIDGNYDAPTAWKVHNDVKLVELWMF